VGIGRDSFPAEQAERFQPTGKLIFSEEIDHDYPSDMQRAFRRFGQGTKVAVQAGLVQEGERVIGALRSRGLALINEGRVEVRTVLTPGGIPH